MLDTTEIKISYFALKLLHLHPEQKFNPISYAFRTIWYINFVIIVIMITLNFLNKELTGEEMTQNINVLLGLMQVENKIVL